MYIYYASIPSVGPSPCSLPTSSEAVGGNKSNCWRSHLALMSRVPFFVKNVQILHYLQSTNPINTIIRHHTEDTWLF